MVGLLFVAIWFLTRSVPIPENVVYGVTFSVPYARDTLGLEWQKVYLAILDELEVKHLRIPAYWTEHEPEKGQYNFSDLDFMLREAEQRGADVILAIGQKLPRWPECHIPLWANQQLRKDRHREFLLYLDKVVRRYKNNKTIRYWQIENEPFLPFGECQEYDRRFLDVEISRLRSLDSRPIVVTDSGELSIWAPAYKRADIFGTTMYRTIWNKYIGSFTYPLPPGYFRMKTRLVQYIYGKKPIIVVELQAEPWGGKMPEDVPLEMQERIMNRAEFEEHIAYERETGFQEVYLWGAEWWWWLKEKHKKPEMWNEAKNLFTEKKR